MFHLMLVMPFFAALTAVYGIFALVLLGGPFWVGVPLQIILTIVTGRRPLLALPAILGGICAVGYGFLLHGLVPLWFQFIYWAVFFLCLWLAWFITSKVKALVLTWLGRR